MKKFKLLLISLLFVAFIAPFGVRAEGEDANDTSEREKINVYIFRGEGCPHCAEALEFFESIKDEYGKYYDLIAYEVYNDESNAALMDKVADYLNITIGGVPFIIVGEETFPGFQASIGEDIKRAIVEEYNKNDDERTDLISDVKNAKEKNYDVVVTVVSLVAVVGIVAFVVYARKGDTSNEARTFNEKKHNVIDEEDEGQDEVVEVKKKSKATKSKVSETNKTSKAKKTATSTAKKKSTTTKKN